jgi:hypothetical protein
MKKVFQTIVDKDKGNCWPAAIASLLNLELDQFPHFNEAGDNCWPAYEKSMRYHGYKEVTRLYNPFRDFIQAGTHGRVDPEWSFERLKEFEGVDGFFEAAVYSPKFSKCSLDYTHAVIIDKNFNIVHDPNPAYQEIVQYPFANTIGFNGILQIAVIEKIK